MKITKSVTFVSKIEHECSKKKKKKKKYEQGIDHRSKINLDLLGPYFI